MQQQQCRRKRTLAPPKSLFSASSVSPLPPPPTHFTHMRLLTHSAEKKLSLSAFILAFCTANNAFLQIFCILVRLF
jgi:hypothetical protein